jgi:hypothetical protein
VIRRHGRLLAAISVGATAAVALPRGRRWPTPAPVPAPVPRPRPPAAPPRPHRVEPPAPPAPVAAPATAAPPAPRSAPAPATATRRVRRPIRGLAALTIGVVAAVALARGTALIAHPSPLAHLRAPAGPQPAPAAPGHKVPAASLAPLPKWHAPAVPPLLKPPVRHTHKVQTVWLAPRTWAAATTRRTSTTKRRPSSSTTHHRSTTHTHTNMPGTWGGDE